jgi:GT2 family glycosyltransferase
MPLMEVYLPEAVSKSARVTVIVVNFNGGEMLADCLGSLTRQTIPPERILVVDNGSADGSLVHAQRIPGIEIMRLGANFGFAAANNKATQECATEFVALLNPDAIAEERWLEALVEAAREHPDTAAFGSLQLLRDRPGWVDGTGDEYHLSGLVWRAGHGRTRDQANEKPREIFSPCAAAALYRREALLDAGGFDEDFFCYVEDVDLGFRLRLLGYKALFVPGAVVHHAGYASTGGRGSRTALYYGHRNLVWAFVKNMPALLLWLLMPVHILMNIVAVFHKGGIGNLKVMLESKADAMAGIHGVIRKRRSIQKRRRASNLDIWRMLCKQMR